MDFLDTAGGKLTLRELRRQMNAYRYSNIWNQAFALAKQVKAVHVSIEGRVRVVTLIGWPASLQARPKPKKRKKRNRGQSEWFREHLLEFQERDRGSDSLDMRPEVREWMLKEGLIR